MNMVYYAMKRFFLVQGTYFAFSMTMYLMQDMFKKGADTQLDIISRGVVSIVFFVIYYVMDTKEKTQYVKGDRQ